MRQDTFITRDGTPIHYKDWGQGRPVVFSHGWPLNSDSWEAQMLHLAANGFRVVAHDRRGHGRSGQPWDGNDMDTYADDLAELMEMLGLRGAVMVGFSTGGGEVARMVGRHGAGRVVRAVLVSAVTPRMIRTQDNPAGVPREVLDRLRLDSLANRSQLYLDLARGPFYGFNRPGAKVSEGLVQNFWRQGMMAGHRSAFECIRAFSETDFTGDLQRIEVPTLVIHGDDDQVVPVGASAEAAMKLLAHAQLSIYAGAPHGLPDTHRKRLNEDLLAFAKEAGPM